MTPNCLRYITTAVVHFTMEDVDLLLECARNHYDAECRMQAADRVPYDHDRPGILVQIKRLLTNFPGHDSTLTFRELDTMGKTLERATSPKETVWGTKTRLELKAQIGYMLTTINAGHIADKPITAPTASDLWTPKH